MVQKKISKFALMANAQSNSVAEGKSGGLPEAIQAGGQPEDGKGSYPSYQAYYQAYKVDGQLALSLDQSAIQAPSEEIKKRPALSLVVNKPEKDYDSSASKSGSGTLLLAERIEQGIWLVIVTASIHLLAFYFSGVHAPDSSGTALVSGQTKLSESVAQEETASLKE
jgi:hypothetical protein